MALHRFTLKINHQVGYETTVSALPADVEIMQRRDTLDINSDIVDLSYSTSLPGGFNTLNCTLREEASDRGRSEFQRFSSVIVFFSDVELFYNGVLVWNGRIEIIEELGDDIIGFTAFGYGICAVSDKIFESSSTTDTTSGAILRSAVTAVATLLTPSPDALRFIDPSVIHNEVDFTKMYLHEIVDAMTKEGGNTGALWDFAVWQSREIEFLPRTIPGFNEGQVDYRIPKDSRVKITRDVRELYGTVNVLYTVTDAVAGTTIESKTADAENLVFTERYDPNNTRVLSIIADEMTAAGAENLRNAQLAVVSTPKVSVSVERNFKDKSSGLANSLGAEREAPVVRSGQWAQVGREAEMILIATEVNVTSGDCSYDFGHISEHDTLKRMVNSIREIKRVVNNVKRGTNPVTGGRKRR